MGIGRHSGGMLEHVLVVDVVVGSRTGLDIVGAIDTGIGQDAGLHGSSGGISHLDSMGKKRTPPREEEAVLHLNDQATGIGAREERYMFRRCSAS